VAPTAIHRRRVLRRCSRLRDLADCHGQHEQSLWNQYLAAPCKGRLSSITVTSITAPHWKPRCPSLVHTMTTSPRSLARFMPFARFDTRVNAVAREIEQKTNRLAWTQSGSRSNGSGVSTSRASRRSWSSAHPVLGALLVVRASHDALDCSQSISHFGFRGDRLRRLLFRSGRRRRLLIRRAGWSLAVCIIFFAGVFLSFADQFDRIW